MPNIKTIAILGATSEMGSSIAKRLVNVSQYRLLLVSVDEAKLIELKSQLEKCDVEIFITSSERDASWEADIIILATPYSSDREIAEKIREVATGKIIVSISNPIIEAYYESGSLRQSSVAEELQKLLPYSKVVKAFNTMFPDDFGMPLTQGKVVDAFIAGNNRDAIGTVSAMVASAGFNPIIVGDLTVSRSLEQTRLKLIQLAMREYNWVGVGRYFTTKKNDHERKD